MGIALKVEAAVAVAKASDAYVTIYVTHRQIAIDVSSLDASKRIDSYVTYLKINPFAYSGIDPWYKWYYDALEEPTDEVTLEFQPLYAEAVDVSDICVTLLNILRTFTDSVSVTDSATALLILERQFADTLATPPDSSTFQFSKRLLDVIYEPTDALAQAFGKPAADTVASTDDISRQWQNYTSAADSTGTSDTSAWSAGKALTDNISAPTDSSTLDFSKRLLDVIYEPTDALAQAFGKPAADTASALDSYAKLDVSRPVDDTLASPTDVFSRVLDFNTSLTDSADTSDNDTLDFSKKLLDVIYQPTDAPTINFGADYSDNLSSPTDNFSRVWTILPSLSDTLTAPTDALTYIIDKQQTLDDSTSTTETLQIVWTRVSVLSGSVNGSLANELMLNSGGIRTEIITYNY